MRLGQGFVVAQPNPPHDGPRLRLSCKPHSHKSTFREHSSYPPGAHDNRRATRHDPGSAWLHGRQYRDLQTLPVR